MRELWEGYRAGVIPVDAPEIKITECRRAFYAGAHGLFLAIMNVFSVPEPSDTEYAQMEAIAEELARFVDSVEKGLDTPPWD